MAEKVTVQLVDDIDGSIANERVNFGLDGVSYTIDLSTANATKLREQLGAYLAAARRIGGRKTRPASKQTAAPAASREQNQAIREWAREKGHQVSDRGRIPHELVVKFQEAQAD